MKQYNSIDVFKLLMAVVVVAIHTHPISNISNQTVQKLYLLLLDIAVPFFFISTGFLLWKKHERDGSVAIKLQLIRLLKMYLIWTVVYTPLAVFYYLDNGIPFIKSLALYIRGLIFTGTHWQSPQLWYLLSCVYALLLLLYIDKKCGLRDGVLLFISGLSVLSNLVCSMIMKINVFTPVLKAAYVIDKLLFENGRMFAGCVYIPIGIILSRRNIKQQYFAIVMAGGILTNILLNNSISSYITTIVTSTCIFGIVSNINFYSNKIKFSVLRQASTFLYLLHMYIYVIYCVLVYQKMETGIDCFFMTIFEASLVYVVYYIFKEHRKRKAVR